MVICASAPVGDVSRPQTYIDLIEITLPSAAVNADCNYLKQRFPKRIHFEGRTKKRPRLFQPSVEDVIEFDAYARKRRATVSALEISYDYPNELIGYLRPRVGFQIPRVYPHRPDRNVIYFAPFQTDPVQPKLYFNCPSKLHPEGPPVFHVDIRLKDEGVRDLGIKSVLDVLRIDRRALLNKYLILIEPPAGSDPLTGNNAIEIYRRKKTAIRHLLIEPFLPLAEPLPNIPEPPEPEAPIEPEKANPIRQRSSPQQATEKLVPRLRPDARKLIEPLLPKIKISPKGGAPRWSYFSSLNALLQRAFGRPIDRMPLRTVDRHLRELRDAGFPARLKKLRGKNPNIDKLLEIL